MKSSHWLAVLLLLVNSLETGADKNWSRGDTRNELAGRVAKAQTMMKSLRLDALLLTTEANVRYFTGYHSPFWQSPARTWFVVVPAEGAPKAVVPTVGQDAFSRAYTSEVVTWPAPRPEDEGVSELLGVLTGLSKQFGRIGAELGVEMTLRMPILDFERLRTGLAEASRQTIVDGSEVLRRLRLIKSQNEVAKVEATCQAMSAAYDQVTSTIWAGMTEAEACNAVKRLFLSMGADDTSYVICRSGPVSYSDIIGHPTERKLAAGDMLIIDSGCQTDGYFCDFNRNFAIGPPSNATKAAYAQVYNATDAALRALQPGITFSELYGAMAKSLGISGEGGVGRMGHSVGLQLTEWPSINAATDVKIESGMVLSIEPSISVEGQSDGAFVVTVEVVVVTETGYQLLSKRAPTQIPEVPLQPSHWALGAACSEKTLLPAIQGPLVTA